MKCKVSVQSNRTKVLQSNRKIWYLCRKYKKKHAEAWEIRVYDRDFNTPLSGSKCISNHISARICLITDQLLQCHFAARTEKRLKVQGIRYQEILKKCMSQNRANAKLEWLVQSNPNTSIQLINASVESHVLHSIQFWQVQQGTSMHNTINNWKCLLSNVKSPLKRPVIVECWGNSWVRPAGLLLLMGGVWRADYEILSPWWLSWVEAVNLDFCH